MTGSSTKINVAEKLKLITQHWQPGIVAELNGQHIKLVKLQGEFPWHSHDNEDELFFVLQGAITLELRDRVVALDAGEFFVVPRGVEHRPSAESEAHVMLMEPAGTLNTGDTENAFTVNDPRWL